MSKCPKELVPTDGEHVDASVIRRMEDYRVSPLNFCPCMGIWMYSH
jgi:hypothetical protein